MAGNAQQVTTGKVRLSYVHIFQPYASNQMQEAKYSTTILVPKIDIATKMRIDAAIQSAIQAGTSEKWGGVRPPMIAIPVHDGDGVRPSDGMPFGEECKGCWVFTASSKTPQAVVDINMNPIINQSEIYSGVYVRVSVQFFAYNSNGKKGIGCGLGPVQKLEDGEPLGGGISAEAAFGGENSYSGQQYQQSMPQYQPQQQIQQYQQSMPQYQPQQQIQQPIPQYQQQQATQLQYQPPIQQINPITGMPLNGPIMGL